MVKLILSQTQALTKQVADLTAEVARLNVENARLKTQMRECWTTRSGKSSPRPLSVSTQVVLTQHVRSYAQPTKSWCSKLAKSDNEQRVSPTATNDSPNTTPIYYDGKLVKKARAAEKHFMQPTRVSQHRTVLGSSRTYNVGWADPDSDVEDNRSLGDYTRPPTPELLPEVDCTMCDKIGAAIADKTDTSLAVRSRLIDNDFASSPAAQCYIPHRFKHQILTKAHKLVQDAIYEALYTHCPELCRDRYLEGPREVKLCYGEITDALGDDGSKLRGPLCAFGGENVFRALAQASSIRNAVCHPCLTMTRGLKFGKNPGIDNLLETAQNVAVILMDEKRAFRIRALRDRVQTEAAKALGEIEAYESLALLPNAVPWKLHHQRLFEDVNSLLKGYAWHLDEYKQYPEVIRRAALHWGLKYASPAKLDPHFEAAVSKAKSFQQKKPAERRRSAFVNTESPVGLGRRASASGALATLVTRLDEEAERQSGPQTVKVAPAIDCW